MKRKAFIARVEGNTDNPRQNSIKAKKRVTWPMKRSISKKRGHTLKKKKKKSVCMSVFLESETVDKGGEYF